MRLPLFSFWMIISFSVCSLVQAQNALHPDDFTPLLSLSHDDRSTVKLESAAIISDHPAGSFLSPDVKVRFDPAQYPQIRFQAAQAWNWSQMSGIAFAVYNPNDFPVKFSVRLDTNSKLTYASSYSSSISISPQESIRCYLPFSSLVDPLSLGMQKGPNPEGLTPDIHILKIKRIPSSQANHITALRVFLNGTTVPTVLSISDIYGLKTPLGQVSYQGIVDAFGQYQKSAWPGKIYHVDTLLKQGQDEENFLQKAVKSSGLDQYGGLLATTQSATGFFHAATIDGRWWLVTPEGHPFFSVGIDEMKVPEETYVEGREFMFRALPSLNDPLSAFYSTKDNRKTAPAPLKRKFFAGKTFNFYEANLYRKYGRDYRQIWIDRSLKRLKAWGFNTIGNWGDKAFLNSHQVPYTTYINDRGYKAWVSSGHDWWGPVPDPFDQSFAIIADKNARLGTAHYKKDPWLIGYFVDNEMSWGDGMSPDYKKHYGLCLGALALGSQSAAKQVFIRQLQLKYGDITRFNAAWGMNLDSWAIALNAPVIVPLPDAVHPDIGKDLSYFLSTFAQTYYKTIAEAIKRYDPDHLYLGSRFDKYNPEAVAACATFCDVVSFNIYSKTPLSAPQWQVFHQLNKPGLIGEFHFGSFDRGMFSYGMVDAGSEGQRGKYYENYMREVASNPDFVGAHWFEYVDEALTGRSWDGENSHIGFVSVTDTPYQDLIDAAKKINHDLVHIHSGHSF